MTLKKEVLERVVAHVLEDAAFVLAEPLEENAPNPEEWRAVGVSLSFRGPVNGQIEMWAPREVALGFAANMLGLDAEDFETEEESLDAMKEVLNIICGNLLTEAMGSEPVFDLGTPEISGSQAPGKAQSKEIEVWMQADGLPVLVRASLAQEETEAA